METIKIQDFEFCNFGSNNYSHGMEAIYAHRDQLPIPVSCLIERIIRGEFYGIWLNPSAPCSSKEFYGFFGTEEQYRKLYKDQRESQIAKIAIRKLGGINSMLNASVEEHRKADEEAEKEYIDWWLK